MSLIGNKGMYVASYSAGVEIIELAVALSIKIIAIHLETSVSGAPLE